MKHYTGKEAKKMLIFEIVLSLTLTFFAVLIVLFIAFRLESGLLKPWLGVTLIILVFISLIVCLLIILKIEQSIGFHFCEKCGNKHIPTYKQISLAPHVGFARYMECPVCGKKSWHKKVLD